MINVILCALGQPLAQSAADTADALEPVNVLVSQTMKLDTGPGLLAINAKPVSVACCAISPVPAPRTVSAMAPVLVLLLRENVNAQLIVVETRVMEPL